MRPLRGEITVPGDKSIGHRALMLGALSAGELRIKGLPDGEDVRSTRRCLEALGVRIEGRAPDVVVKGRGTERPLRAAKTALDCGNSGTSMRLLMGVLSGQEFDSTLTGDASLSRRPMLRVAEPLAKMGARIETTGGHAPVRVHGRRPLKKGRHRLAVGSAQVKSAILLAGLWADGPTTVEDPFGSRDHTERMLRWLGGDGRLKVDGTTVTLAPGPLRSDRELAVPGDPSSAAYFLAAALLVPGSEVTVRGVCLNPTRLGFVDVLREMGADVAIRESSREPEPVGDLTARHSPLRGVTVAAERIPSLVDEVPLLAVVAARAEGITRIKGAGELRHKESDRLEGTADGLRRLGVRARTEGDELVIEGPCAFKGAAIDTLEDHRLAMSFGVAALAAEGEVRLSDERCAAISYPSFFDDLRSLAG